MEQMARTLSEQLAALPLLTTVLRVDFDLYKGPDSFRQATEILLNWANQKCLPFGAVITPDSQQKGQIGERFRLEFSRTASA